MLTSRATTRVLVVEDQKTLAEALVRVLDQEGDLEIVGMAATAEMAVRLVTLERPDVALVDVGLPDLGGIELCQRLRLLAPAIRVVVFTARPSSALARKALDAGARAFLSKDMSLDAVLAAVRNRDETFAVDPALLKDHSEECREPRLSPRETAILDLMVQGHDVRSIAGLLHLSVHTTRGYIKDLYRKLDVHTQLEAVAVGARRQLAESRP